MQKKSEKKFYRVEVQALIPATVNYKILAESPEEAISLIDRSLILERPKLNMFKIKKDHAKVYNFGTHMMVYSKKL